MSSSTRKQPGLTEPMTNEEIAQLGDAILSGDIENWSSKYLGCRCYATIHELEEQLKEKQGG